MLGILMYLLLLGTGVVAALGIMQEEKWMLGLAAGMLVAVWLIYRNISKDVAEDLAQFEGKKGLNIPLGEIAVIRKMLTREDLVNILTRQEKDDKPFGKVAKELGLLTEEQIQQLIKLQQSAIAKAAERSRPGARVVTRKIKA